MEGIETDIGQLSQSEQEALQTYIGVTGQDTSEAISLLQRSQWNVQVGFRYLTSMGI
jgi:FAS-associated factor 2